MSDLVTALPMGARGVTDVHFSSALGGTRTPNLLIRSQMLYPLSYERLGWSVYGRPSSREIGSTLRQPTVWPYISPSGSLISSRRAPSGSLK